MPTGVYLSNDTFQKLNGDLFEQDSRGVIADHFQQQVTSALPDMVAQAQQDEAQRQAAVDQQRQQAEQAQRNAMADSFMASVPDALAQHLGNAAVPPESLQNGPSVVPPSEPTQTPATDLNAAPAPVAQDVTPTAPVTVPLVAPSPSPTAPVSAPMSPVSGWQAVARAAAQKYGIDPDIVARQINQESGFDPTAKSRAGAIGIAQFMPATAQGMGVDPTDPSQALDGAARLMAANLQKYGGDYAKALAAYNAGGGNVDKYGGVPPFEETQRYVNTILNGTGPMANGPSTASATAPQDILAKVQPFLGSSYVWGGKSPNQGFDCSGLAGYLTTGQAESTGTLYGKSAAVGQDQAQPGDLVFWNMGSNDPHLQHVAVYLGNGQIVQSGGDQSKVNIGSVNQAIGSPPEFRRVGPGGAPAQAVAAQQQGVPPEQSAAAAPSGQSPGLFDKLQQLGPAIGKAIGDLFGGATQAAGDATQQVVRNVTQTNPNQAEINSNFANAQASTQALTGATVQLPTDPFSMLGGAGLGAPTSGEQMTQQRNEAIATGNPLRDVPFVGGATTFGAQAALDPTNLLLFGPGAVEAGAEALGDPAVQAFLRARQAGEATTGFASGFDALAAARQAVQHMQERFPQMTPGSLAASGAGRQLAEIEADAAANPALYVPKPVGPTLGAEVSSTLPPGSGPLAPMAEPMEADTTLQGLRNMVAARKPGEAPTAAADLLNLKTEPATSASAQTGRASLPPPNELLGPSGPQAGQLGFDTSLPMGGSRPTGTEALATGPQTGQLQFGSELPLGGSRPTGTEAQGPTGRLRGQLELPGIPPPSGVASLADVFRSYHTGNVVSGLSTLTHVALNSVLAPAWSFVSRGAADVAGLHFDRLAGSGIGAGAGLADSGRAIAQAFSDHFSNPEAIFNKTLPGPLNSGVAKLFLKAQAIPTSLHAVGQSFAQNTITKMEVGRLAGEAATDQGLTGRAWSDFVSNAIHNPTGAIAQQAEALAKRAALRGEPGTVGQMMQKVASVPYVGNTLFPVVRIATNAFSQGIEKSPIGLLGTGLDVARAAVGHSGPYAEGFAGNGIVAPLQERLTNNLAGTALTAWLATKALDGSITGDGPSDPGQKAELMAQGWQPNSVYVPGRGYVDYHALGSLADSFALAGSYGDAVKYGGNKGGTTDDAGTIAESMFKQMGKYLEDATGMRTVGQLYDIFHTQGVGLSQGAKAAAQLGSSIVGGFVPESALVRGVATATDPLARKPVAEAGNLGSLFGQNLAQSLPGLREMVPMRQDIWGQPEANNQQGLGVFSPRTGTGSPDPDIKALMDAGVKFPALPSQVAVSSKYAIDLTPDEKQQYQTLRGQIAKQMIDELVSDPDFAAAPIASRQRYFQMVFTRADKAASQQLISQIPDRDLEDRALANQARRAPVAVASP